MGLQTFVWCDTTCYSWVSCKMRVTSACSGYILCVLLVLRNICSVKAVQKAANVIVIRTCIWTFCNYARSNVFLTSSGICCFPTCRFCSMHSIQNMLYMYHGAWASPWQPFDVPRSICAHNLLLLWAMGDIRDNLPLLWQWGRRGTTLQLRGVPQELKMVVYRDLMLNAMV